MSIWNTTFLQALGWATLNSIWQMALLWGLFQFIHYCFPLSSSKKYKLAAASVFIGFGWYIATFLHYFFNHPTLAAWVAFQYSNTFEILPVVLNAASVAYLLLLIVPSYRIFNNWQFIQKIKTQGLEKAPITNRLFTEKLSFQLGINKGVKVYLSKLVSSPITVGFLKPIILLPVAAVNNLSTQQIEAILLHELAHIRRHDYLVNLVLTLIHVILYFNPFIKAFLKQIEIEREACCDELVLQFEYDKVGYASALLKLEKSVAPVELAMAAANKAHLLHRIEKIVGLPKKRKFETAHFAGAFVGMLMLLAINSIIISRKTKLAADVAIDTFSQPSSPFMYPAAEQAQSVEKDNDHKNMMVASEKASFKKSPAAIFSQELFEPQNFIPADGFMQVSFNETANALLSEEKKQVELTVTNTRKVLEAQWKEVETVMADGMTKSEKAEAKRDYLEEVSNIDWEKIEKELETTYNQRDWAQINGIVSEALAKAQLDSIETSCATILTELHRMESIKAEGILAMPDVSVQQITRAKTELKKQLEAVRKAKAKKIINL